MGKAKSSLFQTSVTSNRVNTTVATHLFTPSVPNTMRLLSLAVFLAGAGAVAALNCWPVGPKGHLVGRSTDRKVTEFYHFEKWRKMDGHPMLTRVNSTNDVFQFHECELPSLHFKKGGQIRSAQHPELCVTPGTVHILKDAEHEEYSTYPQDADDRITLQPCANEHNLVLRKQWFSTFKMPEGCAVQVTQQGWKTDGNSDMVVLSENGVALGANAHTDKTLHMYVASDECL